jgi:hypothetical protein
MQGRKRFRVAPNTSMSRAIPTARAAPRANAQVPVRYSATPDEHAAAGPCASPMVNPWRLHASEGAKR